VESKNKIQVATDHKSGQLRAILYLLQTSLEEFKDEVDRSYELLKVGEKTKLSKSIENKLNDPISNIFDLSKNINARVNEIVHRMVRDFMAQNKAYVKKVFQTRASSNDLHYAIVLKNDTIENRAKFFEFFDAYDLLEISSTQQVYFQFMPLDLAGKIEIHEELKLK
jgi:hypothetical protein